MSNDVRVFLVEEPRRAVDLSTATRYGEVTYIFDGQSRRPSVFDVEGFRSCIIERLDEFRFRPDADVLCIVGNILYTLSVVVAVIELWGFARVLMFDSSTQEYQLRMLGRKQETEDAETEEGLRSRPTTAG